MKVLELVPLLIIYGLLPTLCTSSDACQCGSGDVCALIPPPSAPAFPCYQGTPSDSAVNISIKKI